MPTVTDILKKTKAKGKDGDADADDKKLPKKNALLTFIAAKKKGSDKD